MMILFASRRGRGCGGAPVGRPSPTPAKREKGSRGDALRQRPDYCGVVDVPVLPEPPVLPMPLLPLLVPDPVLPRDRLLEPRFACLPRVERWLDALVPLL
ncbi:hypothetical protein [uncultured Sphingomonas sp.]|uniref:hypothetical protein n=1 Tax=uncultured Sphingomonas sp. TaxID=158754 RepID=UPI0035CB6E21